MNRRSALPGQIVYLAGPMSGLPFAECRKWRDKAHKFLTGLRDARTGDPLYHVLNPLRGHSELVGATCLPCPTAQDTAHFDDVSAERADIRRDRYDVSRSDIVLANLTDTMRLADYGMKDLDDKLMAKVDDPTGAFGDFLDEHVKPLFNRSSVGTICELDQAHLEGKLIIIVMTEDNPHWHSFIKDMACVIFSTLDEALTYMERVLNVSALEE